MPNFAPLLNLWNIPQAILYCFLLFLSFLLLLVPSCQRAVVGNARAAVQSRHTSFLHFGAVVVLVLSVGRLAQVAGSIFMVLSIHGFSFKV